MTTSKLPEGVGWTALVTAYSRAQESREAERLFEDPLAATFITAVHGSGQETGAEFPRLGPAEDNGSSTLWNAFRFYFTQRTPFYDRQVLAAVEAGCRQVVMLGAGLDSRAYRLGLAADITFFEVDRELTFTFKHDVLDRNNAVPTCDRIPVAADITAGVSAALLTAGFDPAVPTLWVAEGLLMYFTRDQADALLDEISALSAPESRFAGEYFSRPWEKADVDYGTLDAGDQSVWDLLLRSFRYGPAGDHPRDWLSAHGWTLREATTVAEVGERTGRPIPVEFGRPGANQVWLFAGGN